MLKKLYVNAEPHTYPKGLIAGYKKENGSVRHVARLFCDRPTQVNEKDAKELLERYPHTYMVWTEERKAYIDAYRRKNVSGKFFEKQKSKSRGPAFRPTTIRKNLNEDEEEIPEEELENPIYNSVPDNQGRGESVTPPYGITTPPTGKPILPKDATPEDEPPPVAKKKATRGRKPGRKTKKK